MDVPSSPPGAAPPAGPGPFFSETRLFEPRLAWHALVPGSLAWDERSSMGFMNRRNAMLGWLAWTVGKRIARRKARAAVPSVDRETKRPNKPAIAAALAALGGIVFFWRRSRPKDDEPTAQA